MGDLVELAKDALSLLGWKVKGCEKDLPPSQRFVALGVVFDLKRTDEPVPMSDISNKESRVTALMADIEEILTKGRLSSHEAAVLSGRLVFAKSQVFGRAGAIALRTLHLRASCMVPREELDVDTIWALEFWQDTLPDAKPREVHLAGFRQPLVIFTDGCCDPSSSSPPGVKAGYGGIMFDPEDNACEFFRKDISEDLKSYLSLQGSKKQMWARLRFSLAC